MDGVKNIGLAYKLWKDLQHRRSIGEDGVINPFKRRQHTHSNHGVPCGGMGSGSVGRLIFEY